MQVHDTDKVLLNPIIESLNQFSKEIERKQINVKIDIDKTVMTKVIGSKTTLETSLFNNLIHNAIKFSEENAEIIIRSYRSTQNAYFIITNKSSRQASESLKSARQFKLSSSLGTSGEIGNGFGLFIADKICKKYGGCHMLLIYKKKLKTV